MSKTDPLAEALGQAQPIAGGTVLKVDVLFGARPLVLDAIRAARNRKPPVSRRTIARLLTADSGTLISEGALVNWCRANGLP